MTKTKRAVSAIILALFAAAVFFVGWVQLRVPAGSYGLLLSRTGGWSKRPIEPGRFAWSWEALLPTNVKVFVFRIESVVEPFDLSGDLPQAALYSSFLPERPDFSYRFAGTVSLRVRPDKLAELVRIRSLFDQTALTAELRAECGRVSSALADIVRSRSADPEFSKDLETGGVTLGESLVRRLEDRFPDVTIESVRVSSSRFPDFLLYAKAKAMYAAFLDAKASYLDPVMKELASQSARDEFELETLGRYGELLTKYPILIDYLAIKRGLWNGRTPAAKE